MIEMGDYRLRAVERGDLSFLKDLRNNKETSKFLGSFCFINEVSQELWFSNLQSRKDYMVLIFEVIRDKVWTRIGLVRLSEIDYINRSIGVGGDIDVSYRGNGYSNQMYKLIFNLCFFQFNMHRLWLLVLDYNARAISLYEKLGFQREGCQRDAIYRDGLYHNYIIMSMLDNEYATNNKILK